MRGSARITLPFASITLSVLATGPARATEFPVEGRPGGGMSPTDVGWPVVGGVQGKDRWLAQARCASARPRFQIHRRLRGGSGSR